LVRKACFQGKKTEYRRQKTEESKAKGKTKKGKIQNLEYRRQDTESFVIDYFICVHLRSPREIGETVISRGKSAVT
jgi:hypothetical protein